MGYTQWRSIGTPNQDNWSSLRIAADRMGGLPKFISVSQAVADQICVYLIGHHLIGLANKISST